MYGVCCRLEGTVDSIPQGLLDGRPASSLVLTHHQYQQLQHIQAQQEQAATGGLTLTLHHQTTGTGTNGVLTGGPQIVLATSQGQGLTTFPTVTTQQAATLHQHTSIQQVLHQHVQHSNILHSTSIRQMGGQQHTSGTMVQQQQATAILDTNTKCIPQSPGSPFSSRSLTPSPQQRVITPQPQVIHQMMSANGPVLQFIQPNSRSNVNNIQVKSKPPPQILPKPNNHIQNHASINSIKSHQSHHSTSIHSQQQGAFLINQIMPTAGVIVSPQNTGGLQLILRSNNTQNNNAQQAQVTCNGTQILLQQPRQQTTNQVVRLVSGVNVNGQSVQLQQIQTSSGPALVALSANPQSTITQSSNNRSMHIKKKKPKIHSRPQDDEPVRLDLANLIKLSGIDEEDSGAPLMQQTQMNQNNRIQQTPTPPPHQQSAPLLAQLQTPTSLSQGGFRLSLGEDGRMIVHQPQITTNTLTQSVSASVAAAAQNQLAQLVADHGGHILQNAVLNVAGAESLLLKGNNTMLPTQPQNGSGVRILADVSGRLQIVTVLEPQSMQQNIINGQHLMFPTTGTPVSVENRQNHQQFVMSTPVEDHQNKVVQHNNSIRVMHSSSTMVSSLDHQQNSSIQLVSNMLDSRLLVAANNDSSANNDILYNEEQNRLQIVTNSSTLNKNVEIQNQSPLIHTSERVMQTSISRSKTVPVSSHSPRSIQSVISPLCSPAMSHSSRSNSKSPASFNSPIPSPNVSQSFAPMLPNRPNLTIVTSPQQSNMQFSKPCAAVISQSNDNQVTLSNYQTSVINRTNNNSPVAITSKVFRPNSPPKASVPFEVQSQNAFLDSIAQSHPNILINKTMVVPPCANKAPIKPRKVKRAAVVKPMVFQCDEKEKEHHDTPVPLNSPESNISNQRVKTIQLTPQKQQLLKTVQNQISVLSAKKYRTSNEQTALQRLFNEQQKILQSGKIVPTMSGQNSQGITYVSTPVRLVPPPCPMTSSPPRTLSPLTVQTPTVVSPPTSNKATSPLHVQVGTQTSCEPSPTLPSFSASKRISLISERISSDQLGATNPDVTSPFSSASDAVKRLSRYHCLNDAVLSERDLELADEIFESTATHLLDKKASLFNKYRYLLFKESMREVQTSELIMLGRLFDAEESAQLQQLKQNLTSNSVNTSTNCSNDEPISKKREHPLEDEQTTSENKRHCPDDEEINAQVQSAIDSILNLQRSDPATDEAVRSILPS